MPLLRDALLPAGLAEAVAAMVLLLCLWRKIASSYTVALTLSAGYASGHACAAGWPSFPPRDATQWLFYFALLAIILATADAVVRQKPTIQLGGWAIVCALACGFLLRPMFVHSWSRSEGCLYLVGLVIGLVLFTWSLLEIERRPFGLSTLLWFATMAAAGTCASLFLSGSFLLGQLAFILAATAGLAFLLLLRFHVRSQPRGAALPLVLILSGLWLSGCFYADLPWSSALLLALAPALSLLVTSRAGGSRWKTFLFQTALVAAPITIAVFLAYRASPPLDIGAVTDKNIDHGRESIDFRKS